MPLSLAFDHRVVDGVEAARFLNVVIRHLEDPNLMLIEGK
jgi:pyruvate/2-oxoglutarate dehydrogenase complex dihydrolipoamide acyltransferase (E2) component